MLCVSIKVLKTYFVTYFAALVVYALTSGSLQSCPSMRPSPVSAVYVRHLGLLHLPAPGLVAPNGMHAMIVTQTALVVLYDGCPFACGLGL